MLPYLGRYSSECSVRALLGLALTLLYKSSRALVPCWQGKEICLAEPKHCRRVDGCCGIDNGSCNHLVGCISCVLSEHGGINQLLQALSALLFASELPRGHWPTPVLPGHVLPPPFCDRLRSSEDRCWLQGLQPKKDYVREPGCGLLLPYRSA